MREWLVDRTTFVWLLSMLATSLSWFLGVNQEPAVLNATASASIILITFFKMYLVMGNFMELRGAPWSLRILCGTWMAVLCACMLTLYCLVLP